MKFVISTFTSSLLLLSTLSAVQASDDFTSLLNKSAIAAASASWGAGEVYSRRLLALPGLTRAEMAAGLTHLCTHLTNTQQFENAQVACDKSIALAPASWAGYVNRSNLLYSLGDYTGARADFEHAKALNPSALVFKASPAYASALYVIRTRVSDNAQIADAAAE